MRSLSRVMHFPAMGLTNLLYTENRSCEKAKKGLDSVGGQPKSAPLSTDIDGVNGVKQQDSSGRRTRPTEVTATEDTTIKKKLTLLDQSGAEDDLREEGIVSWLTLAIVSVSRQAPSISMPARLLRFASAVNSSPATAICSHHDHPQHGIGHG